MAVRTLLIHQAMTQEKIIKDGTRPHAEVFSFGIQKSARARLANRRAAAAAAAAANPRFRFEKDSAAHGGVLDGGAAATAAAATGAAATGAALAHSLTLSAAVVR